MLRDKNSDCTAVLVGNKMDLEGRQVSLEEAQKVG
jgi:GTPase SAR1 family protein